MKKSGLALVVGLMAVGGACAPDTLTAPAAPSASVIRDADGRAVAAPLLVLDGRVLASDAEMDSIQPSDILNVQVLKGERAIHVYGAQGANGVVVITTKYAAAGR
ncbi:MAG TPA: TonB-dependent receptor plug domain-containing protein [Longimicrobium sp.]|nr:TonB-dependent receptor plug domain-containing protein [Longimicrobium sp.]